MQILIVTAGLGSRLRNEIQTRIQRCAADGRFCRDMFELCARILGPAGHNCGAAVLAGSIAPASLIRTAEILTQRPDFALFELRLRQWGHDHCFEVHQAGINCVCSLDALEMELKRHRKRFDEIERYGPKQRPDNRVQTNTCERISDSMTLSKDELDAILGAG